MGRPQSIINKRVYEKAKVALKRGEHSSRMMLRLKIIVSSREHGITLAAKIFGVSPNIIRVWAKRFAQEGMIGLQYREGRGRKRNINQAHEGTIYEWLKMDPNMTLKEIVLRLKEDFDVKTSIPGVHTLLSRLKLSYITPRPIHHKQNREAQLEFKKKCARVT